MELGKGIPTILPAWVQEHVNLGQVFQSREAKMELAIQLSRLNVENGKNGPFGAAVFERDTGKLISVGVNSVVRHQMFRGHAEFLALEAACDVYGCCTLADDGVPPTELFSSTAPCIMCFGAVWWCGPSSLVCGATAADAEAIGFGEGPVPANWAAELRNRHLQGLRSVNVETEFMRKEANRVLQSYKNVGGIIYNAGGAATNQVEG